MQLRRRVALNNVWMDTLDSRIVIQGVDDPDATEDIETVAMYGASGSRVTSMHRSEKDVTVRFGIMIRRNNPQEREEVLEKVNAWAYSGGWLTTNFKDNRKIRVFRAQAASMGDVMDWTKEFAITFRACGVPYWQEADPETVSVGNVSSKSISFGVNGSEQSVLSVQFKNTSGSTVNTFSISTPISSISFTSLGLANGETLVIDRDDTGKKCLLRLRIRNTSNVYRSVMDKRATTSSNDLYINPGTHTVSMSAGGTGTLTVSCNGRFA